MSIIKILKSKSINVQGKVQITGVILALSFNYYSFEQGTVDPPFSRKQNLRAEIVLLGLSLTLMDEANSEYLKK